MRYETQDKEFGVAGTKSKTESAKLDEKRKQKMTDNQQYALSGLDPLSAWVR
ncbi:hypothetical protein [Tangfeifania diversioriginum]|uniref:hypothetical protein n=1 Tax=Tangfeifania diversioriginum TaxID=1168035 RepID=UPI00158744DB|nr:hypothetical protein [Tangfeifania diversioriginum]